MGEIDLSSAFTRFVGKIEPGMITESSKVTVFYPNPNGPGVIEETITTEELRRREEQWRKDHPDQGGFTFVGEFP